MQLAILYIATAAIFLLLDALMLRTVMKPVFESHIGPLLAENLRVGPAAVFYLLYVAGLCWFVSLPALKAGAPLQALWSGALLGFMAYGTYEFTNYATLRDWHPRMVALDLAWGTILTGTAAALGVWIASRLS